MDRARPPVLRILAGAGLSAGLVGLGLALSGPDVRALSSGRRAVAPLEGLPVAVGEALRSDVLYVNGRLSEVLSCRADATPTAVLERYARQAAAETPPGAPYALETSPDGGSVVWVTPAGVHKAAIVERAPEGGVRYRLILDRTRDRVPAANAPFPGGILPPQGAEVAFTVCAPDGTGLLLFEVPHAGYEVTDPLLAALEARGFRPDERARRAYDEAGRSSPGPAAESVTIPFSHVAGALSGHLVVSRGPDGARVSLSVRAPATQQRP